MVHNAFRLLFSAVLILQSSAGENTTDTIWRVITTATRDPARQANVYNILSLDPPLIKVLVGNQGLDNDCILYLSDNGIRISKSYYNGKTNSVHSGKLGLWCSFLRFLDLVQESGKTGVWIEDDVLLKPKHIEEIMQIIQGTHTKAEIRMSHGNGVVVIKNASQMLEVVKNLEITNPVDVFYASHDMVEDVASKSSIEKMTNVTSGITTTTQYPIDLVNQLIEHRMRQDEMHIM
jgi:hypothetical protein